MSDHHNSPYCRLVELRQYTPLLHFQGDTEGACLRASEVKPKLDRFVWDYLNRNQISIPESWQLKNMDEESPYEPALRYKMRFMGNMKKREDKKHLLYFAQNMDGTSIALESLSNTRMTIISLVKDRLGTDCPLYNNKYLENPTICELIDALLPAFFCLHCFGTRNGKGFGSFEIVGSTISDEEIDYYKERDCMKVYRLSSSRNSYSDMNCLDDIYVLSGMMKGGFNRPYYKGDIQKYLWRENIGSEKSFIKQEIFPNETVNNTGESLLDWYNNDLCGGRNHRPQKVYKNNQFLRAMLGLTDHYDYFFYNRNLKKRVVKTIWVKSKNSEITRFANPIRFKPCSGGFRILVYRIPNAMLNKSQASEDNGFEFSFSSKQYTLYTPEFFDLVAFMHYFLSPFHDNKSRKSHNWEALKDKSYQLYYGKNNSQTRFFNDTLDNLRIAYGWEESI